jgi:hypothetical protein
VTGRAAGLAALLGLFAACAPSLRAQSVGVGVDYMGYDFEDGLNAEAARLFLIPVAVRVPVGQSVRFDLYSAWADGRVVQAGTTYQLTGPVDTSVKGAWQAFPGVLVSVGANLPTGNGTHDDEEALVASVLSTDLLGFRESTWGTGFALTSSVALAKTVGSFGLGIAGAYAARNGFEPTEGAQLTYQPGNEIRIRAGIDKNFGTSTLTLGGTFISYAEDRVSDAIGSDRNLFQAGNRLRFDATYAFRSGAGVWTLYAADLMRENGDLRVAVVDAGGTQVGEDMLVTAKQNLLVGGVMGTVGLGSGFVFRPHVELRNQSREEADGNDAGSGWILAAGGDIPLRIKGSEFFPKARVHYGSIKSAIGESVGLLALEFKGTLRVSF